MSKKYERCPICNKKGVYRYNSARIQSKVCRYCKSLWVTARWIRDKLRYEPVSDDVINAKIEKLKSRLKG